MKIIRESNENEMILEFLKGEIKSERFNENLNRILIALRIDESIITNGNVDDSKENILRKTILNQFRGYPDNDLFNKFPKNINWKYALLSKDDINNIYYINYDYWNKLSNQTSLPLEAAKNIKKGITIYDVSNEPIINGLEYLKTNKFPPIILLTSNGIKFLIIEGHSRMTVYGLKPELLQNTNAFVGYCSKEEMEKYDKRMIV